MMRRMNRMLMAAGVGFLTLTGAVRAAAINWSENWTGYASNVPGNPWQLRGVSGGADLDSITTVGGQAWVHNTATGGTNPQLVLSLPAAIGTLINDPVDVSFSFRIPANYGSSSQIKFTINEYYNSVSRPVISILLGRNYEPTIGNYSAYWDKDGVRQNIGLAFLADETVTLNLTNINQSTGTYTLEWVSSRGSFSTDATFNKTNLQNFGEITIGESSGDTSASELYVGAMSIKSSVVPEAASVGLLAVAVPLLLRRRMGK